MDHYTNKSFTTDKVKLITVGFTVHDSDSAVLLIFCLWIFFSESSNILYCYYKLRVTTAKKNLNTTQKFEKLRKAQKYFAKQSCDSEYEFY